MSIIQRKTDELAPGFQSAGNALEGGERPLSDLAKRDHIAANEGRAGLGLL